MCFGSPVFLSCLLSISISNCIHQTVQKNINLTCTFVHFAPHLILIRARSDFERQAVISATALEACSFCAKLPCCMQCMFRMFLAKNFAVDQTCCTSLSQNKHQDQIQQHTHKRQDRHQDLDVNASTSWIFLAGVETDFLLQLFSGEIQCCCGLNVIVRLFFV